jgi:hypothetical protein
MTVEANFFEENDIGSCERDYAGRPLICDWCLRSIIELNPFDQSGDYFDDVPLLRLWRQEFRPNNDLDKICETFFGSCKNVKDYHKARERLKEQYDEGQAEQILRYDQGSKLWGYGYLCRDCIEENLDEDCLQSVMEYLGRKQKMSLEP